jgi:hypothetical protein
LPSKDVVRIHERIFAETLGQNYPTSGLHR